MKHYLETIFPTSPKNWPNENHQTPGLTKREYYIGIAFQAFVTKGYEEANAAKSAINYADALLEELNDETPKAPVIIDTHG